MTTPAFDAKLTLSEPAFTSRGVGVGSSQSDIKARWRERPNTVTPPHFGQSEVWHYSNATIHFDDPPGDQERIANSISLTGADACLNIGLCVGDRLDDALQQIGETEIHPPHSDKPYLLNYLDPRPGKELCWLWVMSEDREAVSEIRLACQP